jgi:DHA1 family tetracycline resistance protein-like MFS transporter
MTGNVPRNEQGELQGALTSMMSITTIIGPLIMNNLFTWFTKSSTGIYFPGISFFVGGFLILISIYLAYISLRKGHHLVVKS